MSPSFTIGIAGSGGDGVILLGELLARTAASSGLHCRLTKSFGPQIRGGETSCRLTLSATVLHGPSDRIDLLAVLNWDGLAHFGNELACAPSALVLSDARETRNDELLAKLGVAGGLLPLPLDEVAQQVAGSKLARNMVLAGKILHALGWPVSSFTAQLGARLGKHGADDLARNERAVLAGYALPLPGLTTTAPALRESAEALELLSGNDAVVRGALAAGCRFMAGYPISPATEILENMLRALPSLGGNCVQAEDEIAAVGLALGAAYGGARSMTATSGPGLSLKVETLGLAVMAEQPLVVVDVQRCGPSTGIPTRTEQADLNIALYGRHGDAPLPVLAPVSIIDCQALTQRAFDIATALRTPVILLSDQQLAQGVATVPFSPSTAAQAASGPAPQPHPPLNASMPLTGLEHDAAGLPSSDAALHHANCADRAGKITSLLRSPLFPPPASYAPSTAGNPGPRAGLLTWGSSYGACCAAADTLAARGVVPAVYAPRLLFPLELDGLTAWLSGLDCLLVVELNHSGQLFHYLHSKQLSFPYITLSHARAGGAAFSAEEICKAADDLLERHAASVATAAS